MQAAGMQRLESIEVRAYAVEMGQQRTLAMTSAWHLPLLHDIWRCRHGFMEILDELIERGPQSFRLECGV